MTSRIFVNFVVFWWKKKAEILRSRTMYHLLEIDNYFLRLMIRVYSRLLSQAFHCKLGLLHLKLFFAASVLRQKDTCNCVSNDHGRIIKIKNFMTSRSGILVLRC